MLSLTLARLDLSHPRRIKRLPVTASGRPAVGSPETAACGDMIAGDDQKRASGHGFERGESLCIPVIKENSTRGSRGWLRWPWRHAPERGDAAYAG
jgi:hypothetical protein